MLYGTVVPNNPVPDAAAAHYFDSFEVHNRFYGAQVGLSSEVRSGKFFFAADGKIGLGVAEQDARIAGGTVLRSAAGAARPPTTAGVLAQPGDLGDYDRGRFSAVAEAAFHAGYQFTPHLRALVGWDFLYLSQVAGPAAPIGPVDSRQVPQLNPSGPSGPATRPALQQSGGFTAEGLTCGLEFRY